MQTEFAPAKLNLYLHVTGRRADGYHLLESLVAFAEVGDRLSFEPAVRPELVIEGPHAALLAGEPAEKNLVMRALRGFADRFGGEQGYRTRLEKILPMAAGLGGGSADAAAALRVLARRAGIELDDPALRALALDLGADVPMCLDARPCYVSGIGEVLIPAPEMPEAGLLLVNPGVGVPTPAVFAALKARGRPFDPPAPPLSALDFSTVARLAHALGQRTNTLTDAAIQIAPAIADVLEKLRATPDCLLARMLGSGATCYGLYPSPAESEIAAGFLRARHPEWTARAWVMPGGFYRHQNQSPGVSRFA